MTADERQIVQKARDTDKRARLHPEPEPPPAPVVDEARARRVREYNRDLIRELNKVALERAARQKRESDRRARRARAEFARAVDGAAAAQETPVYARVRAACALGTPEIDLDAHATLVTAVVLRAQGALA